MSLQTRLDALITAIGADMKLKANKASPVLTGPVNYQEIATPANPAGGTNNLYFKTDDKLYKQTSVGVESEVGGTLTTSPLPSARLGRATTLLTGNFTTLTYVTRTNETPSAGYFTTGTTPWDRFIIPEDGLYSITSSVVWPTTTTATGRRILLVTVNNAAPTAVDDTGVLVGDHILPPAFASSVWQNITDSRYFTAGDIIRSIVWSSGLETTGTNAGNISQASMEISRIAGVKGDTGPAGAGDMTLAGIQTVTGAKTFNTGKLLMTSTVGTGEPYSDANPPESLMMTEWTAPSSPAAGLGVLYLLSDKKIYFKDSSGLVTLITHASEVFPFSRSGALTVLAGTARMYLNGSYTYDSCEVGIGTAPTGAAVIVDINKNGTTIHTTQTRRPTIAVSTFRATTTALPDVTTFVAGDYITLDVDQIGSTIAGSDLTVALRLRRTA